MAPMGDVVVPEIVTERLLVGLPPRDAAARMLAFYAENRAHLDPWSPPHPPGFFTERYWRERIAAWHSEFRAGTSARFVFVERSDASGPIVGHASFTQVVRGPFQACYLGYAIDARREGLGYMTEGLAASIRFVFDEMRLHRVMANYVPTNERSGSVLRRLGFVVEGYARDYLFVGGAWRDHVLTSLTNPAAGEPE
jgi:ribosomal-protein-alanine N-acetyltransferase